MITSRHADEHTEAPPASQFVPLGEAVHDTPQVDDPSASIMADMAGGADAPIDLGARKRRVKVSSQLVLMVSVLMLSAAALYFMRRLGTGAGMTFVAVPIDYALDQETPDLTEHQHMIALLESSGIILQVPSDAVAKNPFQLVTKEEIDNVDLSNLDPDAQARIAAELRRKDVEKRQREIDDAIATVNVHSILNGSRPVANINGNLVGIGDMVAGVLKVASIEDRAVIFEVDGKQHRVEMEENAAPKRTRRRPQ